MLTLSGLSLAVARAFAARKKADRAQPTDEHAIGCRFWYGSSNLPARIDGMVYAVINARLPSIVHHADLVGVGHRVGADDPIIRMDKIVVPGDEILGYTTERCGGAKPRFRIQKQGSISRFGAQRGFVADRFEIRDVNDVAIGATVKQAAHAGLAFVERIGELIQCGIRRTAEAQKSNQCYGFQYFHKFGLSSFVR